VVAATNVNVLDAVSRGKFREDLYYRLNTVPIHVPALRERKNDMLLLFRRFSIDFSQKYRMPPIELNEETENILLKYSFPGNVRQLKNMVEQISIIESDRLITKDLLQKYIPQEYAYSSLPILKTNPVNLSNDMAFERELIFKFLAEMQKDIADLKNRLSDLASSASNRNEQKPLLLDSEKLLSNDFNDENIELAEYIDENTEVFSANSDTLSLQKNEQEMIRKALEKNKGKRKHTAEDLEISERTLYRKLKEYGLDN